MAATNDGGSHFHSLYGWALPLSPHFFARIFFSVRAVVLFVFPHPFISNRSLPEAGIGVCDRIIMSTCHSCREAHQILRASGIDLVNLTTTDKTILRQRPTHGTTVFLSASDLPTAYGLFRLLVFQDLINQSYMMAVVSPRGDIRQSPRLLTRAHSSCISSETLHGCDCDCVEQLHGALHRIAQSETGGILFYMMQEGRGTCYPIKARGLQITQFSRDATDTFEAYACMALKPDYRDYRCCRDIVHLIGLRPDVEWVLLSNNPDKVQGLQSAGFHIADVCNLEFTPGPFNSAYLKSKAKSGHHLMLVKEKVSNLVSSSLPTSIEPDQPFEPYAIEIAPRFIRFASYLLPVRPVDQQIILSQADYEQLADEIQASGVPYDTEILSNGDTNDAQDSTEIRRLIRFKCQSDHEIPAVLRGKPYWFRVHVFRDIVLQADFVMLQFVAKGCQQKTPLLRMQNESLWNRFPLSQDDANAKPKLALTRSMAEIAKYGHGYVLLYPHDSRGLGFASLAASFMMKQVLAAGQSNTVTSTPNMSRSPSNEALADNAAGCANRALLEDSSMESVFSALGISPDRDYSDRLAAAKLLSFFNVKRVKLIAHNRDTKEKWSVGLIRAGILIDEYVSVV